MQIKDLGGEFALLSRVLPRPHKAADLLVPNGDDAAVLRSGDKLLAISTDTFVEGRHFVMDFFSPRQVGIKTLEASASDIVAMGGRPRLALINLTLPHNCSVERVEEIYAGFGESGSRLDVQLIGGDTTAAEFEQLVISVTVLGFIKSEAQICQRSGAKPGDLIFVSGDLGSARAGLDALQRGLGGFDTLKLAQLEPRARVDLVEHIAPIATSMIDISDGLASEIHHICKASKCGAVIYSEKLPCSLELERIAAQLGKQPLDYALYGGEDFELLYTVAPSKQKFAVGHQIGVVTESGVTLKCEGKSSELQPRGFDHFI